MSQSGGSRGLSGQQRSVLEKALARLGLGDEEGRRIFLLALGYELAAYVPRIAERLSEPPPDPPTELPPRLAALERDVARMRAQLAAMGGEDRGALLQRMNDTSHFGHRYDEAYLEALDAELAALSAACAPPEPPAPPDPSADPAVRELVGLIAKAYEECFDAVPDADVNGPFARLLATVFVQADLDLPVTSRLVQSGLEPTGERGH